MKPLTALPTPFVLLILALAALVAGGGRAAGQDAPPDSAIAAQAAARAAPANPATPDMPRAISLDEALETARRNAPRAIAAAGNRRTSDAAVRSAYAAFLPNLTLSAGATRQFPSRGGTRIENGQVVTLPAEPWSQNAGFSTSLTLFQGGRRIFDLRQARAQAAAGDVNEEAELYAVALDTKARYFGVLAARKPRCFFAKMVG
jgi:outer membrane protein TolC